MAIWSEMSYRRFANRRNELEREKSLYEERDGVYYYGLIDDIYLDSTFSVEDLSTFDYDEV